MTDPAGMVILVNGAEHGAFEVQDPALWTGMGVFETLRTWGPRVFRCEPHMDRLAGSARWMGWAWDREAVTREVHALGAIGGDRKVNVLLTETQRVVTSSPLDQSRVGAGIRCATVAFDAPPWLPGFVKHTSRASWLLAVRHVAAKLGEPLDEVLWQDAAGCWTEANRSNLVAVRDGVLITPPLDGRILEGCTRAWVIQAAAWAGMQVTEAPLPSGVPWAELYVTSTLKELAPVVRVDAREGWSWGPVGLRLRAAMTAFAEAEMRHPVSGIAP